MQGDEPQMTQSRPDEGGFLGWCVQPGQKKPQLPVQVFCRRGLKMHTPPADGSRDDLHWPQGIVTPGTDPDPGEARVAGRKEGGMPAKQPFPREGRLTVGGGIEHHLHHAIGLAIRGCQRPDIHPQTPREGRAHRGDIELLALDLTGLDDVIGQGVQAGLVAAGHANIGQPAQQQPLGPADLRQGARQGGEVITPMWPVIPLPEVGTFAAIHAVIMGRIHRGGQANLA